MYSFPAEMRKNYECSPLSFVYYQNIDGKGVPILASDGFCRKTGMSRDRVLKWLEAGLFVRMHPDDVGIVSEISDKFLRQQGPYDVVFRCRIGEQYEYIHGLGHWQKMPDGTELAVIGYMNVTETKDNMFTVSEAYDLFRKDRFYTDPLTVLPNINYMHEYASEKVKLIHADERTPHLVYCDIYSMQSYNNHYGFSEGDKLLCLVAETLKSLFPKALLLRGADDHFIIITGVDDKQELSRRMSIANDRIKKNAYGNTFGIRVGICEIENDINEALDHAKHALRQINNDMTRITAFFSQEADDEYWKSRYILENLDRALEQKWIKVFYQGIFREKTLKIAAFEALARWVDPMRGTISPGEFIPVLQRYHQLYKLDLYMLEQVCREIPIRKENGLPLVPVSINFSRQDFDHVDVVGTMNELYDQFGLEQYVDKSYFAVEITEQDVAVGKENFLCQLESIRENGYQLWLDDFGSGYSAINMFSQCRFDLIKYDMDLIRHLDDNGGANRLILKELVYVAKKLKLLTLTEGVENEEQMQFLRDIGCELVQGYYYYRPEPLDEILFRIHGGMKVKDCETQEERAEYNANHDEDRSPQSGDGEPAIQTMRCLHSGHEKPTFRP